MPSLKIKMKDENFYMESSSSLVEFDSARYSQIDTNSIKFSTSTPKKSKAYHTILGDSDSENDIELHSERISSVSTVLTSSLSDIESISTSDTKLDIDVIEQLQIHNRRVWNRK